MNYVTDTHSLVWYFTNDGRLSSKALQSFQSSVNEGTIFIPAVVLAEIMYIADKGRIVLSFEETLCKIEEADNFEITPLDTEILKIAFQNGPELEMHDRLILATALFHNLPLITKDESLQTLSFVTTIW